ncbi:hypothetical protein NE237_024144 [Protea cynaroides]|uniref:Glycosyltransferase n=1 Tax=Protea cynaroides TaxID=273540 RepID=A0A9Q0K6N0_9MAGN|nr:hypothetical protein NE237_024144 [Protea cynaroides]
MEGTIVLFPMMAMGHLVSIVELGKLILRHYHHRFSVTILIAEGPLDTPDVTTFLRHISESTHSIYFHYLPSFSMNPSLHGNPRLQTISKTYSVRAFVIDFFGNLSLNVASDLGILTYYFLTGGAVTLSFFLHLPTIHNQTTKSFKDTPTTHLHFPGLPSILMNFYQQRQHKVQQIPASNLPEPVQDREDPTYNYFVEIGLNLRRSKGIMLNTFEGNYAITDGLCIPDAPTPPVYCVRPLIASTENREGITVNRCISWLDSQPSQSIVFLCFGSGGVFSTAQVREIAIGLKSGQRFLWVVRNPVSDDNNKHYSVEIKEPNLQALLSEGFSDRNMERGLVVKCWAPQVEVLNHKSVGGFVTHCGWNSVLEAVFAGVPMVAWPLYAEQHMNKAFLVEEMKLAMSMEKSVDGLVSAAEVENKIRALMECKEGRVLRGRSRKMKEEAMDVWSDCGSSMIAFTRLVESWVSQ